MPNNIVQDLAKKTRKSVSEVEKLWDKAKEIATDTFGKSEKNFKDKEWAYVTGTLKNMLGIKESTFEDFLESKEDLITFISEDAQASGDFSGITPNHVSKVIDYSKTEEEEEKLKEAISKNTENIQKEINKIILTSLRIQTLAASQAYEIYSNVLKGLGVTPLDIFKSATTVDKLTDQNSWISQIVSNLLFSFIAPGVKWSESEMGNYSEEEIRNKLIKMIDANVNTKIDFLYNIQKAKKNWSGAIDALMKS